MTKLEYGWTISAAVVAVSLSTLVVGPETAEAQTAEWSEADLAPGIGTERSTAPRASRSHRPRVRDPRGAFGKEFLGALGGFFVGELGGFAIALPVAAAIPPEENNLFIVLGGTAAGALGGAGLGAGAAGDASGGNGSIPAAVLGSTVGTFAAAAPVGIVGGWASASDATTLRNVTLMAGIPLVWAGTLFGGVLGYRWSAPPAGVTGLVPRFVPYAGLPTPARGTSFGFTLQF